MQPRGRGAPFIALALVFACSAGHPLHWKSKFGRRHELAGAIWDVAGQRYIDTGALETALRRPRFVILGEQHGNVDHHRLQAHLIATMAERGSRPAVAFEMLSTDQAADVAECLSQPGCSAESLRRAVDWDRSGWSQWPIYEPVFKAALAKGRTIAAVGLPRATARELVSAGDEPEMQALIKALGIEQPLAPEAEAAMAEEIRQAHCGHVPESLNAGMIRAQRARDSTMAMGLAVAAGSDGKAVLIAGFGHARLDRGVPAYLAAGADLVSIAFVEVEDGVIDPQAYASKFGAAELPFHYVWFTPRVDNDDPCAKFSHELRKIGS